jgi:hypothetical protein
VVRHLDAEHFSELAIEVRGLAQRALRMRRAADFPLPGSPVIIAKPPSARENSMRRQNESIAAVTSSASVGASRNG